MNVTETVLVGVAIINVLLLFLVFSIYVSMMGLKFNISQIHSGISTAIIKLTAIEQFSQRLGTSFTEFINVVEGMMERLDNVMHIKNGQVYKTVDGKYTAGSIEELIEKIKRNNEEDDHFSEEEMDKLRNLFETDDDDETSLD